MPIYNIGTGKSSGGLTLVPLSSNKSSISLTSSTTTSDFTITYTGDGTLTATSSNTAVATVGLVSGKTYRVTGQSNVADGSAVITVKASAGATTYPMNEVTINVDVDTAVATNILNNNSWSVISQVSAAGQGDTYWDVGDRKAITLNGTIGDNLTLNNTTLYVYILGFDHNSSVEGTGISFGTFKTALGGENDVALIDSWYGYSNTTGTSFNMNNSNSSIGWKQCRMRYYILGSTDSSSGNDATATTAINPVSNTLMAALPSELRAVMKPITKYSDNTGDGSNTAACVTTTTDYLPLLAEYEVFGIGYLANNNEQTYQAQYEYYEDGNSTVKYRHSSTSSTCDWWLRSAFAYDNGYFGAVSFNGNPDAVEANIDLGVAPMFLV